MSMVCFIVLSHAPVKLSSSWFCSLYSKLCPQMQGRCTQWWL